MSKSIEILDAVYPGDYFLLDINCDIREAVLDAKLPEDSYGYAGTFKIKVEFTPYEETTNQK